MVVKLRPVLYSGTWYDYKMAVAGTLIDYGMYLRVNKKRDTVVIYRKGIDFTKTEAVVITYPKKSIKWKDFYLNELPKILEMD